MDAVYPASLDDVVHSWLRVDPVHLLLSGPGPRRLISHVARDAGAEGAGGRIRLRYFGRAPHPQERGGRHRGRHQWRGLNLRSSRLSNAVLLGLANPPMRFQGWPLPTQPSEKDSPAGVRRSDVRLGSVEHL